MYAACAIIWYLSLYANPSSNAVAMMFTSFCDFYKSVSLLAQNWHVAQAGWLLVFYCRHKAHALWLLFFFDVLKFRSQNWHVGCLPFFFNCFVLSVLRFLSENSVLGKSYAFARHCIFFLNNLSVHSFIKKHWLRCWSPQNWHVAALSFFILLLFCHAQPKLTCWLLTVLLQLFCLRSFCSSWLTQPKLTCWLLCSWWLSLFAGKRKSVSWENASLFP